MIQSLLIIMLKNNEDYIAKYSKLNTTTIVSIFQRRIIDSDGHIDQGIIGDRKALLQDYENLSTEEDTQSMI